MSTLLFTLLAAFVLVALAILSLGIGWLITGKNKMHPGACGRDPNKNSQECGTGVSCDLCHKSDEKKKE